MFESLFGDSTTLTTLQFVLVVLVSIGCGLLTSLVYILTHKEKSDNSGFATTLFMLPVVVCVIIILVASDFARAFSIAGVFALIRFRSEPGESKDITYILLTSGLGLACGLGYIYVAIAMAVLCCILLFVLQKTNYGKTKAIRKHLRIVIPENLNYTHCFDEALDKYCSYYLFEKVKTTDYGSLFEVTYTVSLKNESEEKQFIDELRVLNANLDITLVLI